MITDAKSLLPKKICNRDALTYRALNIKPRFFKGLRRLKNILCTLPLGVIAILSLGLYPIGFSSVSSKPVVASEQNHQIIAEILKDPIITPHPGYISTRFSSYHPGVDIATGYGMPIHPITAGVVEEVNFGFWGLGNHIIISHDRGLKSLYAHMGRVFVKKGQLITPANTIGEVGMTGQTSGPHTHLEITKFDRFIDPLSILPKIDDYPLKGYHKPHGGYTNATQTDLHKHLKPDFN